MRTYKKLELGIFRFYKQDIVQALSPKKILDVGGVRSVYFVLPQRPLQAAHPALLWDQP